MGVVNLPKQRAVIDSIGPNFAVRPSTQDDFIGEDSAKRVDSALSGGVLRGRSDASCSHCVRVGIPKSHRSILTAGDELIGDAWHEPDLENGFRMVLAKEHLREVLIPQSVDIALLRRDQTLETIWTR